MSASVSVPFDVEPVPVERIKLMYMSRKSLRLIVQRIQMPADSVDERLYDAILVAWAKIKSSVDLDFIYAADKDELILVTRESLTYYTMRASMEANREMLDALEPMG